jgi:hypothetical protein
MTATTVQTAVEELNTNKLAVVAVDTDVMSGDGTVGAPLTIIRISGGVY